MAAPILAQEPNTWTRTYGGSASDVGQSVQQTSDSGYIITGYTSSYGAGSNDVWLIKTDSLGDTLWAKTYGGSENDAGNSVQQTLDGGYIITGYTNSYGAGESDVWLIKTDPSGDTLWTKTYGGENNDYSYSVQQTLDGGYFIAGDTWGYYGPYDINDILLIKTDSLGDTLWTKIYDGGWWEHAEFAVQTTDGGYIVTGYWDCRAPDRRQVLLMKTDSLGDTLWTKTYGLDFHDYGECIQQTSDGGYIVVGWIQRWGPIRNEYLYLIKTNSSGDILWTKSYGDTTPQVDLQDRGYYVQQTSDDGYIITGYTKTYGVGEGDVWLLKTDSLGDTLWTMTYGGELNDGGYCLDQTSDGGYIIAGYTNSYGAGESDVWLIKTDSLGNTVLVSVVVGTPDGDEQWIGGTVHDIVWHCDDPFMLVDRYRLLLSTDSGSSYQDTIADNIPPTDTCYTWTIPSIRCYSCKVKVQAMDSLENIIAEDESNDVFTILPPPVIASLQYPMFCYDLARTGRSQCYGSLLDNIKWWVETENPVSSSPVIAPDGTIYFTSENDTLYALNIDGTKKWAVWLGNATASTPAIGVDSTIYIGSDGKLSAYEPNGELKWEYEVSGSVVGSPVGSDNAIYFGSTNDTLYAVYTDGTLKWKYAAEGDILSSPAVSPYGIIYVGSNDHKLYAINPDGTEEWSVSTDGAIISSPAVNTSTGIIYVGSCDGKLYAIGSDGTIVNTYTTGDTITSSPAIGADGTIFFGSYNGKLYALNPDLSLKWEYQTGGNIESSPTISYHTSDNREFIYVGSDDSTVYCFKGSDGTVIWSAVTDDIITSSPAIADSSFTIYIGSNDGNLYAFGPNPDVPVTLISPNGGEQWLSNTVYDIYWATPGGATSITLHFSLSNSTPPWYPIAVGELDDGVFLWRTPDITCSTCRVKVTSFYPSGDSAVDISDADFSIGETGVEEAAIPQVFALGQNCPNPAYRNTVISYQLPKKRKLSIKLYDVRGRYVNTLVDGNMEPGFHSATWNTCDNKGKKLASGIYFYKLVAGEYVVTKKMVILR